MSGLEKDWTYNFYDITCWKLQGEAGTIARYRQGLFGQAKEEKKSTGSGAGGSGGAKVNSEAKVDGVKMTMFGSQ
jgi:hypothetical protein